MPDLEGERDRVDRALAEAGVGWDGWPDVAATARLDDRARLSALLLLLAAPAPPREPGRGYFVLHDDTGPVIDRLRRRRLPWDATTAVLALDAVMSRGAFDGRRVAVALRGVERVCSAGAADVALIAVLERCASWLDEIPDDYWQLEDMRLLVRRVIASATPPELLDLSLIRDGDGWARKARASARTFNADEIAALVRRLGELGGRKPSQSWLRATQEALRPASAAELLRSWLGDAAYADVVQPGTSTRSAVGALFSSGNDDVVRAAVIACRFLPDADWVPGVLGVLARRGAATSGQPGMTASLSLKVASAAIDTLAVRGSAGDRAVLEELLEDLSRRDLVKRVGEALGRQDQAAERDEALRRQKAAAVRRKADPAPRARRAAVDALLRRHLAPELRRHGFGGSGRTWRRFHEDRVDVVALGSWEERLSVSYGTRFDAAHPDDEPYAVDRAKIFDYHLDIRLSEHWSPRAPDLDRCAAHLAEVVVPFLDTLARYEFARDVLERGVGVPAEAMSLSNPGSPAASGTLGMLAKAAGDRVTAVDHLTRRVAAAESWASSASAGDDSGHADVVFWRRQLGGLD